MDETKSRSALTYQGIPSSASDCWKRVSPGPQAGLRAQLFFPLPSEMLSVSFPGETLFSGSGSFGKIYYAINSQNGQEVAVKLEEHTGTLALHLFFEEVFPFRLVVAKRAHQTLETIAF